MRTGICYFTKVYKNVSLFFNKKEKKSIEFYRDDKKENIF